ncbi:MAG TPA: ATP-binding cassette domain-containing protein [Dehalococcoidia bacterium]|nr:ATP-binding cassette domain-containing protein [Dehalococcoidia bacterium]
MGSPRSEVGSVIPLEQHLVADAPGPLVVETKDLWFSFNNSRPVLKGVDLAIPKGGVTMVLGASGSGKTTLLKLIKGLLRPQRGQIRVLGHSATAAKPLRSLIPEVAYIPQHLGLVRNLPVLENTLTGALGRLGTLPSLLRIFPREWVQEAEGLLAGLGIAHKRDEKVHALSGGERQRVAIARALMQHPRVILADEFISQLDPVTSGEIMDNMRRMVDDGTTLLMTTHELEMVARYGDWVAVLRDGEKVLDCPGSEVSLKALGQVIKP